MAEECIKIKLAGVHSDTVIIYQLVYVVNYSECKILLYLPSDAFIWWISYTHVYHIDNNSGPFTFTAAILNSGVQILSLENCSNLFTALNLQLLPLTLTGNILMIQN